MKHFISIFAAITLAATISAAQSSEPTKGATAPAQTQQQTSQPSSPSSAKGQQQPPAAQPPAQQPAGKKRPEAKTQAEFTDFQQAQASQTSDALEKAADAFAQKYPASELRGILYSRAMMMYQQQNNPEKLLEMARKVLAIDPNDPIANVFTATFLPERVRETDLDKDEKYAEATKAANTALANVDNMVSNADAPPDKVEANKNLIRSMAYAALGTIALNQSDAAAAEQNLKKAIDAGKDINSDPVMYLRYSVALDRQKKYQEALLAANKALELSPQGSSYYNLANQERTRLMQLMGSTGGAKPAAAPTTPQTQPTTPPAAPTTPK
jgi:tetratricopeptide (TPR) repeat protein